MSLQPWFKLCLAHLLSVIITFANPATHLQAASSHKAFFPGEKLKFRLKWGFIPAGEAVLEVLPIEIIDGIESYHFVMTARTNAFIDAFYKYRSRIDAYADTDMTRSIMYRKIVEARKKIREVVVNFDWEKSEVQYHGVKKYTDDAVKTSGKKNLMNRGSIRESLIAVLPGSFDPLSVFYYSRSIPLNENTYIQRPVSDGKKCIMGAAKVKRREKVRLASGTYDTYLIEPSLEHLEGVFEKSKKAKIQLWLTNDEHRIPVKLKSKIVIGSFTGELISFTSGQNNTRYPKP
jgi:hypothetical protein